MSETGDLTDAIYGDLGVAIEWGFKRPAELGAKLGRLLDLTVVVERAGGRADRLQRVRALEAILRDMINQFELDATSATESKSPDELRGVRADVLRKLFQIDDEAPARRAGLRRQAIVDNLVHWIKKPEEFRGGIERALRWEVAHEIVRLEMAARAKAPIASPAGAPHGSGISHAHFPYGYRFDGRGQASFNNYLDKTQASDYAYNDERLFLAARITTPERVPLKGFASGPLRVRPGQVVRLSAYIHNNADAFDNDGGSGPSAARNSRLLIAWPDPPVGRQLFVLAYLYADNALVDEAHRDLHTIVGYVELRSDSQEEVRMHYVPGSAVLLQKRRGWYRLWLRDYYQTWTLTGDQQNMLFTGDRQRVHDQIEITPHSGLPIGNDGTFRASSSLGQRPEDRLRWFGCDPYHGYLQFLVRIDHP